MRRPQLSPVTYRRITLVATFLLAAIIVTGGAVRLSGSGLGCPDWPTCGASLEHGPTAGHTQIEFVNRLFTGLVSVAVIACVLGSLFRLPRRRDLVWLSLGLVGGVFVQAVLGGLTVIFELQPQLVMAHFLASLVLLTNAIVLFRRAGAPDVPARPAVVPSVRNLGKLLLVVAGVVVTTGTIVTATGPHGGDKDVKRFDFHLPDVARIHGISVVAFIVLIVATFWLLRRSGAPWNVQQHLGVVALLVLVQAVIGYVQYFNDIPPLLVGFHIAGATAVWAAVIAYYLALSTRAESGAGAPVPPDVSDESGAPERSTSSLART